MDKYRQRAATQTFYADEPQYRIELDPTEDSATVYLDNIYISDPVAVANLVRWIDHYERNGVTVLEAINGLLAGRALNDD